MENVKTSFEGTKSQINMETQNKIAYEDILGDIPNNIEYEEYYLTKSNIIYKLIVGKNINSIFIKYKK